MALHVESSLFCPASGYLADKIAAPRRAAQPLLWHCAQMRRYNLEWLRRDTLAWA